ncbi:MAG: NAD-dependent epimerase/dehydratase family protein [Anaeromyxobacteraceae bacterium]
MRCFVTGATGFVGSAAVRALVRRRYDVIGLVRSAAGARSVEALGARAVVADLRGEGWREAARRADAIVHCAQAAYYTRRITPVLERDVGVQDHAWVRALLTAGALRARAFVYASGAWVYGDRGEALTDERAPLAPYRAARFKVKGERIALDGARALGFASATAVRLGQVYGPGGPFLAGVLAPMLRGRRGRYVGTGRQWASLVHVDDAGEALARAAERRAGFDPVNVADDEPVHVADYMRFLAERLGTGAPRRLPAFAAALVAGGIAEPLAGGVRLVSARAAEVLGWRPAYPTFREGFPEVLAELTGCAAA